MINFSSSAQGDFKNSIYGEIGGNLGYYSINYERMISKQLPMRFGLCIFPKNAVIALLAGKIFGRNGDYFEISTGIIYAKSIIDGPVEATVYHSMAATAFVGYRNQIFQDRLLFRVGYTPVFGRSFSHWAGLSLGYRF